MTPESGPSLNTFRVLAVACAGLLVAGAASAATYDDDTLDQTAADGTTTTVAGPSDTIGDTTVDPAPVDPATGAPATTPPAGGVPETAPPVPESPTTTAGAAPTTTVAPATTTTQANSGPKAPSPIAVGSYKYGTDGTMTIGTSTRKLPPVTSLNAEAADGDGRQVQIRDLRDDKGDGSISRTSFRYTSEGVYLEKIVLEVTIGGIGQTTTLTSAKPFLIVPAKVAPGTKTTGTLTGDGITATVTFTVASVSGDLAVSDLVTELTGDVEGRQTTRFTARTSDLLTVEEKVDGDFRSGGIVFKTNYTAKLR